MISTPGDSVYVVKILYARADSAAGIAPLALQRLYAIREAGAPFGFKLAAAFPRVTKDWDRRVKGPLTFIYAPGQQPNSRRSDSAARFVDSVARLFDVPLPEHLDVIVGQSMDDVMRGLGLDFFIEPSGPGVRSGGRTLGPMLLVGNPDIGEAYYHEFVHAILGPHIRAGSLLLAEGVATWLGGSRGRTPAQMYGAVYRYQREDSTLTFTGLFKKGSSSTIRCAPRIFFTAQGRCSRTQSTNGTVSTACANSTRRVVTPRPCCARSHARWICRSTIRRHSIAGGARKRPLTPTLSDDRKVRSGLPDGYKRFPLTLSGTAPIVLEQ